MVIEKPFELGHYIALAKEHAVRPDIGFRVRLHARGSGKWEKSGGFTSKFGLNTAQTPAYELRRGGQASGVEDGDQPGRQPNAIPRLEELRSDDCAGRETPPIGRLDHVAEDATPAFTASCLRVRRVDTGPVGGLDQVAARLGERPASVFSLRRCSHSCQVTRIGLALKIDE